MDEVVLQSLIGTDKRNPFIHVCRRVDNDQLEIYYGVQRLETVVDDKNHISFRAAVGRLYNAGLSRAKLSSIFDVDRKTMARWGEALLMPDAESSLRGLRSRSEPRKLTPEVRRFAEVRFEFIYPRNRYTYSREIRDEIRETFGVEIASSTLRPVFRACRERLMAGEGVERENSSDSGCDGCGNCCEEEDGDDEIGPDFQTEQPGRGDGVEAENRHQSPRNAMNSPPVRSIHHAGVLIFSNWLLEIARVHVRGKLLRQWLVTVLLESVNIEQSKYVNWESLELFIGDTVPGTVKQRSLLGEVAVSNASQAVLRLNANVAGVSDCRDFYYDPHTKHYTGASKLLKGWCSSIRWADKALHCDYVHTSHGMPVFVEYADNFHDLRERFESVVASFRKTVGMAPGEKLTVAMDRGVYGIEVFQRVQRDPAMDLVSWEKGFVGGEFDPSKCAGEFMISLPRNCSNDLRSYHFAYMDGLWERDESIRRLIVLATNPNGKVAEVGILSTDLHRDADLLIRLMFRRWLQENDFKYLDKHYGINQITSYSKTKYADLRNTVADKQEENGQRKALLTERRGVEKRLKDLLHREHRRRNRIAALEKEIAEIDSTHNAQDDSGPVAKRRRRLQARLKRNQAIDCTPKKHELDGQIDELSRRVAECTVTVSKLDRVVEQGYQRLDINKKRLMDSIKILARNIFYTMLRPFRESYDNYRDDHEYFRRLTHAPGLWVATKSEIAVYLDPSPYLPPKTARCMRSFLDDLQQTPLLLPDGSGRTVVLKLRPTEGIQLAIA
jgi:transposase